MLAHFLKENRHRSELKPRTGLKHSDDIYPKSDCKYLSYTPLKFFKIRFRRRTNFAAMRFWSVNQTISKIV
jgi:hypothetical protein